jgi:hypothetical protein
MLLETVLSGQCALFLSHCGLLCIHLWFLGWQVHPFPSRLAPLLTVLLVIDVSCVLVVSCLILGNGVGLWLDLGLAMYCSCLFLIALTQVSSVGKPAAACRYLIVWLIVGKSYTLFALSFLDSFSADIVHSFAPLDLLPWRTGRSVVVMETVPCLCTVTPSTHGWKIIVYPSSAILLTLMSGDFNPGRMSASLAF